MMTLEQIDYLVSIREAGGRNTMPVPISEWREYMAARIAAASVKVNKATGRKVLKPIDRAPKHAKIARDNKADRAEASWLAATSEAFRAGAADQAKGKTIDQNPHSDGRTKQAKEWRAGFAKAFAKAFAEAKKASRKAKAA